MPKRPSSSLCSGGDSVLDNDKADRSVAVRKALFQLPENVTAEQIEDYVDRAELYFFARTNRRAVPVRATLLWADTAVAMFKADSSADASGTTGAVTSIKRGDTSVQYASGADALTDFSPSVTLSKRIDYYRVVRSK